MVTVNRSAFHYVINFAHRCLSQLEVFRVSLYELRRDAFYIAKINWWFKKK